MRDNSDSFARARERMVTAAKDWGRDPKHRGGDADR
jgi:hypothetical protein